MAMRETEPVRAFTGDHRSLSTNLLARLETARAGIANTLASVDCKTFEEYRHYRGQIAGLDVAIAICKEVQGRMES